MNESWEMSIFIPDGVSTSPAASDPAVDNHALRDYVPGLRRIAKVVPDEVKGQWDKTIRTLMELSGKVGNAAAGWTVEEMEVGLTLSAKGELLFIAEAGAEASIKLTLKRKP